MKLEEPVAPPAPDSKLFLVVVVLQACRPSCFVVLSLLDDLLGIGLDLLFLLFDNLGQLLHSALERLLYLFDSGFSSHFDFLVDFFGDFRRLGHLSVLGFLLDLFGFVFELADGSGHGGDLTTDGSDFRLLLIKNGSSSLESLFNL